MQEDWLQCESLRSVTMRLTRVVRGNRTTGTHNFPENRLRVCNKQITKHGQSEQGLGGERSGGCCVVSDGGPGRWLNTVTRSGQTAVQYSRLLYCICISSLHFDAPEKVPRSGGADTVIEDPEDEDHEDQTKQATTFQLNESMEVI